MRKFFTHWKAYAAAAGCLLVALGELLQGDVRGALTAASLLLGAGTTAYLRRAADFVVAVEKALARTEDKSCSGDSPAPSA